MVFHWVSLDGFHGVQFGSQRHCSVRRTSWDPRGLCQNQALFGFPANFQESNTGQDASPEDAPPPFGGIYSDTIICIQVCRTQPASGMTRNITITWAMFTSISLGRFECDMQHFGKARSCEVSFMFSFVSFPTSRKRTTGTLRLLKRRPNMVDCNLHPNCNRGCDY